jgi:hypothetical protein
MTLEISSQARQPPQNAWSHKQLLREQAIALGHAIDSSTAHTYNSHLQSYLMFCKLHNFPIDPTLDTLSFYVVFMAHHIKPASVTSYLSGICNLLEPLFPRVWSSRCSPLVIKALVGMHKL